MPESTAIERTLVPAAPVERGGITPVPFQFLTTGEDHLQVDSFNSQSGVQLEVALRFLSAAAKAPVAHREVHTPNTDRTKATSRHRLGIGAILNIRVAAIAGAPRIGQTFVIVRVFRGFEGGRTVLGTLLQGYVTENQDLGWPGSPIVSSLDSEPYQRLIPGTDPAPGVSIQETIPSGARWRLRAVYVQLQTSAAAANRRVALFIRTGGGYPSGTSMSPYTQVASTLVAYQWQLGMATEVALSSTNIQMGLPDVPILAPGDFLIQAENFQAGDNYGQFNYTVDEWIEAN